MMGHPEVVINSGDMARVCRCPFCSAELTEFTGLSNKRHGPVPKVGDPAICKDCGGIMVFGLGLVLRAATPEEEASFLERSELLRRLQAEYRSGRH